MKNFKGKKCDRGGGDIHQDILAQKEKKKNREPCRLG
jgi:hypothetical protein